jgi:hypothetical protein
MRAALPALSTATTTARPSGWRIELMPWIPTEPVTFHHFDQLLPAPSCQLWRV